MYELNGARFVERYVLTSIQNGSQPAPLNEPCLVHDLFQEIHGKPNTVEILANSVLSNCDVLLLPNNQLTDDEQMYSFLLDEMENLRWLFNNITTEYVCNVKEVCYNMIEKVENNRSMLIPIIHSFSYLAFFAYEEAVTAVFTKEEAIELLQKYVNQPLVINQLQFGVAHTPMLDQELFFNMTADQSVDRSSEILEYCRLKDIAIQAWSPFQYGFFEGVFLGNSKYAELNRILEELGEKYGTGSTGIASAWILRHPANMQLIAGTMKTSRLKEICEASEIVLTREEWYRIYLAGGHILP